MRISDWSSDVCSSDLLAGDQPRPCGHRLEPCRGSTRAKLGTGGTRAAVGSRRTMSDLPPTDPATSADPPPPSRMDSAAEREVAQAEAAATRRRWITHAQGPPIAGGPAATAAPAANWSPP